MLRRSGLALAVYGGLLFLTWLGFSSVPAGFIPQQDKQYLVAYAQLPEAATLDRTEEVIRQMDRILLSEPGVAHAVSFPGFSINGFVNSPNSGIAFAGLSDFSRDGKTVTNSGRSAWEIAASLNQKFGQIQDAYIAVFPPPAVQGLGQIGGFKVQIEDRAGLGFEALYAETQKLVAAGRARPELANVFSGFEINAPQVKANIDRDKAQSQGVALSDLFETMQVYLGSLYVNDFNRFGRTYQVNAQADMPFPARARRHPAPEGAQRRGRDGAARLVRHARAERGPERRAALQRLPECRDHGRPGARALVRPGAGGDRGARGRRAAERPRVRLDRARVSATDRRQHGCIGSFRCACCSRFSCSPRSTKAGRCRWS